MSDSIDEIRGILLKLADDMGQVKGRLETLSSISQRVDSIGDIAKSAKSSTESAHKRLDEMFLQTAEIQKAREMAAAAKQRADDSDRKLEKMDSKLWGVILTCIGLAAKIVFDMFSDK